jgi:hypothetical protein
MSEWPDVWPIPRRNEAEHKPEFTKTMTLHREFNSSVKEDQLFSISNHARCRIPGLLAGMIYAGSPQISTDRDYHYNCFVGRASICQLPVSFASSKSQCVTGTEKDE